MIQSWPLPWYRFASGRFHITSGSQVSQNPWAGRQNVYGPHRQLWRCELQMVPLDEFEWEPVSAFFSEAGGQSGLIRISDPRRRKPQYNREATLAQQAWSDGTFFSDGTGWINGGVPATFHIAEAATRGATYVVVGGLPASVSRLLRRGDLIEIRRNGIADHVPSLHEIIRDASTDADGKSGLMIRPGLRKGVMAGDQVVSDTPTGVFRCIDDEQGVMDVTPPSIGRTGFTLIEAII